MTEVTYEIVEHDGGWAYRVDGSFSETFTSHDAAVSAARRAAAEQQVGGRDEGIVYEDDKGVWHEEIAEGGDRPQTQAKD